MKKLSFILTTLFLSLFAQAAYAECTIEQKVNLAKLDLSAKEIQKACSSDTSVSAGDKGTDISINVDSNNINSNNNRPKKKKISYSSKFRNEDFFKPKAERFFIYAGLRGKSIKPDKHEESSPVSPELSLSYFPKSVKARSFGLGLTLLDVQSGKFKETGQSKKNWATSQVNAQLFYVLSQGSLFSTIPFVGTGVGVYQRDTSAKTVKGTFRTASMGVKLISRKVYTVGRGFYLKAAVETYSKIKIDDSSKKYKVPATLDVSIGYMW